MLRRTSVWRAGKFTLAGIFIAATASAQSVQPAPDVAWPPRWTVSAGVESLWWRDAAQMGPPIDGSPVSWDGSGPIVYIAHDRGRRSRLHHFEGTFTVSGGFELRSPVRSTTALEDDGASRVSGRYEYHRYPWRDLWISGFDVGFGVEGAGDQMAFHRRFAADISLDRRITNLRTAGLLAARWRRSERWSLHAVWGNGITLGRSITDYRSDVEYAHQRWGGGWQSTLDVRGEVRVSAGARLTAGWFTSGEGRLESHNMHSFGRSRFTVGVSYGR